MSFKDEFSEFLKEVPDRKTRSKNETQTRNNLIDRFIDLLGYEYQDIEPEFVADIGTKFGEKVDYALHVDGKPAIFIEAKTASSPLGHDDMSQLLRYYGTQPSVKVGILTNGTVYKFYTDLRDVNIMDREPFLVLDLNKPLSDQPIDAILLFHKQNYDYSKVREHAEFNINKDKIQSSVDAFLSCFLSGSDREIYGEILKDAKVHDGPITRYLIDKYSSVISEAVNNYIGQKISIQSSNETVPEVVKPCSSDELYHIKGWKDPDQAYLKVLGPKQFVVVRGSFLNKLSPNCEKAKNQRQEHLAKISSGRLTQDVELSTASAAGMLAYGTNVNGWVVWVNDNDSPLKKARPDLYI